MQKTLIAEKNSKVIQSVLLLLTFLAYSRFLFFSHISWDDPEMVFKNSDVRTFDLVAFFTDHYVGNYIPVTMVVHALSWALFRDWDGGHHLVNIILHLVNGFLVLQIGRHLFRKETVALVGAAFFLLHPLQVESVGWIGELKNVLSTTFYLGAFLQYIHFSETKKNKHLFLCFCLFVLGCLSKSSVVVFPVVLICYDVFFSGQFRWKSLLNKLPYFAVSIVIGVINIKTQTADQFINHAHEFPFFQRAGFAGFAIAKYVLLVLFPFQLSVLYPYPPGKMAVFFTGFIIILIVLLVFILLLRKKKKQWNFLILFIAVNLILVLQFLPFGEVLYADRYLYVPMIGFGWIIGLIVQQLDIKKEWLLIPLTVLLGVATLSRSGVWKDAISLYEDILKKYPDQFVALNSAGVESMFLNEDQKALAYLDRATSVAPGNYKGFYNKGLLFLKKGNTRAAIENFNKVLDLYDYSKAYTGRASAYYALGDIPKAMQDAGMALEKEPTNSRAYFILGNCYNDLNNLDEAIKSYNKAIGIAPSESDFYFKRAIARGKKQEFDQCLADLDACIDLNSAHTEAYYWRGVAKVNLRRDPCPDFRKAAENNYEPAINAYQRYCRK